MPRTLLRTLLTSASSLLLLVVTALPALAASAGTKPTKEADPYLIGSMDQLPAALIVGAVIAVLAWVMLPSRDATAEDEQH